MYSEFFVRCVRILLCTVVFACVNKGTMIFLQAMGKVKVSTLLSMMREILFGVGLPLLLPLFMGLDGLLYFMPLADILTFVASAVMLMRTNRELTPQNSKL